VIHTDKSFGLDSAPHFRTSKFELEAAGSIRDNMMIDQDSYRAEEEQSTVRELLENSTN
jgi:dihydroorotase